jgi:hypothetical protein
MNDSDGTQTTDAPEQAGSSENPQSAIRNSCFALRSGFAEQGPQSDASPPATGYRLPATPPDRGNHHWLVWEIGSLLGWATAGKDWPTISLRLERSVSACQRQLGRLLAGETPCPALYAASLAAAKVMFAPVPKPAPTPPGTATAAPGRSAISAAAMDRLNAQYRALAAANAEVRETMSEIQNMLTFGLACQLIAGEITAAEVSRFLGPNKANLAGALAFDIKQSRVDRPGLFGDGDADGTKTEPGTRNMERGPAVSSPGSRFPVPGSSVASPPDAPLVSTGQGTSEERLYPHDLVEGRAAGGSLDVMA